MAINQITYSNKADINVNSNVPDTNKVKADDMNEIKTVVNSNATLMGDVSTLTGSTDIVDYLTDHTSATLLWTNSSMGADDYFNQQNINLSSGDYDVLEVFFYDYSKNKRFSSVRVPKGKPINLNSIFDYNQKAYAGFRTLYYNNATQLWANDCYAMVTAGAFSNLTISNQWCIPAYIVGYKTGLF